MAAAIRIRIRNFTRNYVQLLVSPSHTIKLKQRICFHNSAFLCAVGQELKMPSLSPTMSEGTIVKWLKKEGDPIAPGDVLCDIQTDKAVVSFETEEEGILAKILIKEDQKEIKVGTVIALMVADGEDWKSVELPKLAGLQSSVPQSSDSVSRPTTGSGVVGQELKMPSLSPTMSEGTIVKWLKKEGDPIAPGDVLCDIQTDKAVVSFETEEEGILARILVQEGAKDIKVGTVIALMVDEGQDWKLAESPGQAASSGAPSPPPSPKAGSGVPAQEIKMPSLSPTMTEGTIVKWMKKEGDTIQPGDVLCDIQTDKAVVSFETEEEGILAKILVPENQPGVNVGTLIALMVAPGESWQNVDVPSGAPSAAASSPPSSSAAQSSKMVDTSHGNFGPATRVLLEHHQIQPDQVPASGRKGRLLKEDVQKYIMANNLKPKPPKSVPLPGVAKVAQKLEETKASPKPKPATIKDNSYIDHELTAMRRTIAKRLTESKRTIPHAYSTVDSKVDKLLALRDQCREEGIKLSVNDFVIKAAALALQHVPQVNALYQGDKVIYPSNIDVSVAVATDMGLITPIVKEANAKTLQIISKEVRQLVKKAREGKLQPHEFQGGTFSISNLGMFGVKEFTAIINPPQCAILAVGTSRSVLDVELKPATKMKITLSYDRRAIDEVLAAQFLVAIKQQLEDPMLMLVGPHEVKEAVEDEL